MFRQRIPIDVQQQVRGHVLSVPIGPDVIQLPVTDNANELGFSLRTREPEEAKVRWSVVNTYLQTVYSGLRMNAPMRLTRDQCVALAADFYRAWTALAPDDENWSELIVDVDNAESSSVEQRVIRVLSAIGDS